MACTFLSVVQLLLQWRQIYTNERESKEFDPEEIIDSGLPQSWPPQALPDSISDTFVTELEMQEFPKRRSDIKGAQAKSPEDEKSQASSPERPPEVTSAVRRRSSVGIQRQASVCLSDEEDQELSAVVQKLHGPPKREVTKVSAVVHHSGNDRPPAHSWEQKYVGPAPSQPSMAIRHPPFIHSHSSPDSRSTATKLEIKQGRMPSTFSLRGVAADSLARVVDLEDYHYSRQQVWELAAQGATLLKERSQSNLDVAGGEGWEELPSRIQQAASTEAGLLEQSLEQHQLENLRTLRRYSPVDEEDGRTWSKVRYNDTGSREDIRDEVIEIISGESEDESSSSIENEIMKQQYRKLWELRATLEEEEGGLSDTQEIEDEDEAKEMPPLAQPEECAPCTSQATSFESAVDVAAEDDPEGDCEEGYCEYLQLPLHALRRHCYKSLLAKRLQRRTPSDHRTSSAGGGESSFESVESSSTDRTEGATTSFESTTDNTDSAGESQTNRLQQMKADSGYKSIESNGKAPRLSKKQLQFALDGDSLDAMFTLEGSLEEELSFDVSESIEKDITKTKSTTDTAKKTVLAGGMSTDIPVIVETLTEKKRSKSALKKHHTEGDICSEQQTLSDIPSESRGKTSVFQRFFRSGRFRVDPLQVYRDYSIDEKSDALFREFSRPDLHEGEFHRNRGSRLHGHIRLHHRPLPPVDSCSPRLARKVLSPQLSIEEESCESGEEHQCESENKRSQKAGDDLRSPHKTQAQIPVIYLSQGRGERPT